MFPTQVSPGHLGLTITSKNLHARRLEQIAEACDQKPKQDSLVLLLLPARVGEDRFFFFFSGELKQKLKKLPGTRRVDYHTFCPGVS